VEQAALQMRMGTGRPGLALDRASTRSGRILCLKTSKGDASRKNRVSLVVMALTTSFSMVPLRSAFTLE
jgi:hypothetical protein